MLSIYPTLVELCGLPQYSANEGRSLVDIMRSQETGEDYYAITTFGMNNHTVRTKNHRYIQYEDGLGELYDMVKDPEEHVNLFSHPDFQEVIARHRQLLPDNNQVWNQHSQYNFQPYFVEQKARVLEQLN